MTAKPLLARAGQKAGGGGIVESDRSHSSEACTPSVASQQSNIPEAFVPQKLTPEIRNTYDTQ